jgi:DNA-binding MarR family transcriptional regulator
MAYNDRAEAVAQDPTPEIISGPKPSNVVTDLRSREQWQAAFRAVALAKNYTKTEILLVGALAQNFYCKTGKCDPGNKKLAAQLSVTERTIKSATKTLEADGWCSRKRGGRDENVNFTLSIPFGIGEAMPSPMEDVPDVTNADSIGEAFGHFSGSIGEATASPLNTEVEQRRAGLYGPRSSDVETQHLSANGNKSADDAALNPAFETCIPDTTSAPTVRRLVSNPVDRKDHAEILALNAPCCLIRIAAANGANVTPIDLAGHAARRPDNQPPHHKGHDAMARIARTREQMFTNLKNIYPIVGLDDETNFAAFALALDHGCDRDELFADALDQRDYAKDGRDVVPLVEFLLSKCWIEAIAA